MAPETPAPNAISKDITWIRGHAIVALLSVALIAGSIIGGMTLFENLIERHDARVAAAQQKKEDVDTTTQANLLQQLAQDRAADAARDAAQTTLIASLISQMKQQQAVTAKQVATDSTLDAQASAARLATQTKAASTEVTAANNSVTMSLPVTRTVVAALDELPQAQSDASNLQSQLGAQQILTSDAKSEVATENQVIAADKTELLATIKADNAACDVRVDNQEKKDHKRALWLTILTAIGGAVIGHGL